MGRTEQKQQALRQIIAAGEGDYADEAAYELGRSHIAQEQYAEGAAQLEKFVADYPSSPRRAQALSDLGLAYLNLGDKEKSLRYYDMVVETAPQSSEAKGAMEGIREIYVSEGRVDDYFDYAQKAGLESALTAVSRDSLSFAAAQKLYLGGQRDAAAKAAAVRTGAGYLAALGGAGALMAKSVQTLEVIAWPDLGCEAVRRLTVRDMPLTVVLDAHGGDLYEEGPAAYLAAL